ncbi:hypothetical protein B0T10DRAFT_546720 [Thelonectria olida]|uniref:G domain-containing protein n=1 Tax=Thelonectria olida TaxID=1576542 RepID=A0A9P8WC22_9HYPO|nr:hypothetical protein B0T10DRAFT_546720 [Thelonectria olida]
MPPRGYNESSHDIRQDTPSPPPLDTMKIAIEDPVSAVMDECPRFRILVIGKTGAGKSTICSRVFNVPYLDMKTSMEAVWKEVRFPQVNDSIIFHDSGGFEAGAGDTMREVEKFIAHRRNQPHLRDQIHCIWYCINCADNRPFQASEERFFRRIDVGKIPVVVVFTQYDRLVQQKRGEVDDEFQDDDSLSRKAIRDMGDARAFEHYENKLVRPLQKLVGYRSRIIMKRTSLPSESRQRPGQPGPSGLDDLLGETRAILTSDGLKLLLTIAQRVDADSKLQQSLDRGIAAFWIVQGWGMVPIIPGISVISMTMAFKKVYRVISRLWNIPTDPLGLFERNTIRHQFYAACLDTTRVGWIGYKAALVGNIVGSLTAGMTADMLLRIVAGVALIHESLFWVHKEKGNIPLSERHVMKALKTYRLSKQRRNAMSRIYNDSTILTGYSKEKCLDTLRAAIELGESQTYREMLKKETLAED